MIPGDCDSAIKVPAKILVNPERVDFIHYIGTSVAL